MALQACRVQVCWLLASALAVGGRWPMALADPAAECHLSLAVALTPDVPNPGDGGFLSSLLGDHPGYRLIMLRSPDSSVIRLELRGPGPRYECRRVLDSLRKDARVRSIEELEAPDPSA